MKTVRKHRSICGIISLSWLCVVLVFGGYACSRGKVPAPASEPSAIPERPDALGLGRVRFELPTVERWELPNGMIVFYRFDDELPQVNGKLYLPGGKLYETESELGLSDALGSQMRSGSVEGLAPEVLDKTLDDLAAAIETTYGAEFGAVSFRCLSEDIEQVFSLFSRVVRTPSFDESRLALWKRLSTDAIRRRRDNPEVMAGMAFSQLLYGKQSPFASAPTVSSIESITRARLQEFHRRYVQPKGGRLVISGALPRADLVRLLEKNFGSWKSESKTELKLPDVTHQITPGIYVLERDFEQASILIGHLGPPRLTPDIYEMSIYNRIFGAGGFSSRLFKEIRSHLGLAYDVDGGLAPGVVKGTFQVNLGTRSTEALRAVREVLSITRDTLDTLPENEGFTEAMSAVEQSFVFRFDSNDEIVTRAAQQELLGYPKDFDATYLDKVSRVTPEKVREVGRRWVQPDGMVIVIVGRVSAEELARRAPAEGVKLPIYRLEFTTEPIVQGLVGASSGS